MLETGSLPFLGFSLLPLTIYVVILFLFGATSFTAATWTYFTGGDARMAQLVALVVPTLYVAVIFAHFRWQHLVLEIAGKVTSVAMGFLNFAFLAALACWPAVWAARVANLPVNPAATALVLFSCSLPVALYGLFNAARLRVTKYTIHLRNLPLSWQGRNVALVSDIHVGAIRGSDFVRRVVTLLQGLAPKAVFISGDMFDGAKVDIAKSVEPLTELRTPAGIYFVTGNHDEFGDPRPALAGLTRAGVRVLYNEKVVVEGVQIIGINDSATHRAALYQELLERAQIDPLRPSILLAHRPTHLEIAAEAGISLQLSGHTHAGQFPLWSQLVKKIYGRFAYGLNCLGSLQVVTSSGAGSGGPPFRVGTRAEIVLLRLELATPVASSLAPAESK